MDVLCACDRRFLPHTATMLCSLLEHNPGSQIHLFHGPAMGNGLEKLKAVVTNYRGEIAVYEMTAKDLQYLRVDKWASSANYYRLLAPRILPAGIKKILYLDSDVIVRHSLSDLWDTDLRDLALGAVEEFYWHPASPDHIQLPTGAKYFNSGVMLINLDYWRRNNVCERALAFIRENPGKVNYWDQDALNVLLVGHWISLPALWNAQGEALPPRRPPVDPAIAHFAGEVKPWHLTLGGPAAHPLRHEYRQYPT